jgi:hypothetical protein
LGVFDTPIVGFASSRVTFTYPYAGAYTLMTLKLLTANTFLEGDMIQLSMPYVNVTDMTHNGDFIITDQWLNSWKVRWQEGDEWPNTPNYRLDMPCV